MISKNFWCYIICPSAVDMHLTCSWIPGSKGMYLHFQWQWYEYWI